MAFYRGKRVSEYRKQHWSSRDTSLTAGSPHITELAARPSDREALIKNIRGLVTITPYESVVSSLYNNISTGYICLVRYPATESFTVADLNMEASWLLHPVPFAMFGVSQTIPYEFKGITLGNLEKLYLVIKPETSEGTNASCFQLLWAQKDIVVP